MMIHPISDEKKIIIISKFMKHTVRSKREEEEAEKEEKKWMNTENHFAWQLWKGAAYVKWYDENKIDGVRRRYTINFALLFAMNGDGFDNGKSRIVWWNCSIHLGYHQ